jgi:hypothetical protein
MAFLRGRQGEPARRGNEVVAVSRTKHWKIDRATLDGLTPEKRRLRSGTGSV